MNTPHFRIVLPADMKYKKHVANDAKIFMSVDGGEEAEITQLWPIVSFEVGWYVDNVTALKLTVAGSVEVQYGE